MTRPVRALVSGYYGFANAGDEAILAGLVEGFRQRTPHVQLTVLSGDARATQAEHNVAAVSRGLSKAFSCLRESDLLISGGGGLLQDATSWRSPLYYLAMLRLARAAGVPTACIGQSIGPLRRRWVRWLARGELSRVELVAVRDRLSQEALRGLGLTREIEVTADLAFLLARPGEPATEAAWQRAGLVREQRPTAAIALRRPVGRPCAASVPQAPSLSLHPRALATAIGTGCRQLDLRPVLMPMHQPQDRELAEEIAAQMPVPADIVRPDLTAREMLAFIGGCDLVIAMRLHALIFAAICGRPLVAISYDPKVDGLMEDLGLRAATSVADLDAEGLARAIGEAWQDREAMAASLAQQAERLRAAAGRNIELALALTRRQAS